MRERRKEPPALGSLLHTSSQLFFVRSQFDQTIMASRTMMASQRKPPTGSHLKRGNQQSDKCEAFCIALANKLDVLEQAVHPKWMTLEWVSVAVEFMRTTYSDMVTLFEDLRAHSQDVRGSEDFWVEEYMVESMKLLDVCNVIKPAMSRFEHLMMCVQLVVQASQRCSPGSQEYMSDKSLTIALQSCEQELKQLVHLSLTNSSTFPSLLHSQSERHLLNPNAGFNNNVGPARHASIAIGEKFIVPPQIPPPPPPTSKSAKGRGSVGLAQVMQVTRETTDFIASILVWALLRDSSSHPTSTIWQQNLEVFQGDENVWSLSFRRLQERLRKEMFELIRDERATRKLQSYPFSFEELKLVEESTSNLRVEIEVLLARVELGEEPPVQLLESTVQQMGKLLGHIQEGLENVSNQVNQLFNELVRARKRLLDAAQGPGTIHRSHTF